MNLDQDTIIAYALDILPEQEMLSVEQHLKTNPDDALEVKRYLNTLTAFVMIDEPEDVSWAEEQKLFARVRSQGDTKQTLKATQIEQAITGQESDSDIIKLEPNSRRKYQWGLGWAVAASLALISLAGPLSTWVNEAQVNNQIVDAIQQSGATSIALMNDKNEIIGTLVRQEDNGLFVVLKEKLSEEQVYQAWNIVEGQPQSMGIYNEGLIEVSGFEEGNVFGISIEPAGGSEQPTSTPIVVYEL